MTDLKAVGIDITIDLAEPGRFVQLTTGGWTNMLVYRNFQVTPDWLSYLNGYTGTNVTESKSLLRPPGYQDALDAALVAPDLATKKTLSQKVVQMAFDETIGIPLWATQQPLMVQKNVHNMDYYIPWGANALWGPADVWLDK